VRRAGGTGESERTIGFLIDEVLGEEDTLVKALPRYLQHARPSWVVALLVAGDPTPSSICASLPRRAVPRRRYASPRADRAHLPRTCGGVQAGGANCRRQSLHASLAGDAYEHGGYRVETAEDGEAALGIIARSGLPI